MEQLVELVVPEVKLVEVDPEFELAAVADVVLLAEPEPEAALCWRRNIASE